MEVKTDSRGAIVRGELRGRGRAGLPGHLIILTAFNAHVQNNDDSCLGWVESRRRSRRSNAVGKSCSSE